MGGVSPSPFKLISWRGASRINKGDENIQRKEIITGQSPSITFTRVDTTSRIRQQMKRLRVHAKRQSPRDLNRHSTELLRQKAAAGAVGPTAAAGPCRGVRRKQDICRRRLDVSLAFNLRHSSGIIFVMLHCVSAQFRVVVMMRYPVPAGCRGGNYSNIRQICGDVSITTAQ